MLESNAGGIKFDSKLEKNKFLGEGRGILAYIK